jgi:formylglycine-generating enzyme required for sulfatase activity
LAAGLVVTVRADDDSNQKTISNKIGMKLVMIPAGEFLMGSPSADAHSDQDERPQHRVRISKPLYMGVHEVTVGQFARFVEATGHETDAEKGVGGAVIDFNTGKVVVDRKYHWRNPGFEQGDDHPVVQVSWNDAMAFCKWLSESEGETYRLPTEAEWEYACRAGTSSRFSSGDDEASLRRFANIADGALNNHQAIRWASAWDDGHAFTASVGRFLPNAFGLYDMHGNVWEWCSDWYDAGYYKSSPEVDPTGPGAGTVRVLRGGAWYYRARDNRSAFRYRARPDLRDFMNGFRVVKPVGAQ